jgi:hypothetical protein
MTEAATLEVHIDTENQLFNSMDPAPFRRRELDPALVDYIIAFGEKAPASADLELSIQLTTAPPGVDIEAVITEAVCENFRRRAADSRRALRRLFHDGRISLVIGIAFVGLAVLIGEWLGAYLAISHYAQVIVDTFVIGSWVALWHPVNIFLFEWWPILRQAQLYDRLSTMRVRVRP